MATSARLCHREFMSTQVSSHPVVPDTRELPLNLEIARHAYDLWERYGRPEGRDVAIWLEAERQLLGADEKVNKHAGGAVLARPLEDAVYSPSVPAENSPLPGRTKAAAAAHRPR